MRTEKEILDALKILQEVCNNSVCRSCILRNGDDECGVLKDTNGDNYDSLEEWYLKEIDKPRVILN